MTDEELTTEEIAVIILYKLARRGAWGEAYMPKDTLVRHLAMKVKRNGKRVRKVMDSLVRGGFLFMHKGGKTVSLNPSRKSEILKVIKEF